MPKERITFFSVYITSEGNMGIVTEPIAEQTMSEQANGAVPIRELSFFLVTVAQGLSNGDASLAKKALELALSEGLSFVGKVEEVRG